MDYAKRKVGHIKSTANLARSCRRAPFIIPALSMGIWTNALRERTGGRNPAAEIIE